MSFTYPWLLALLPLPAALAVWTWRSRGRPIVLPFDHARPRPGRILRALVNIAGSLPPLLLAVAILLLAGPQRLAAPTSKRVMTNIEFCVDVSGSMTSSFGAGTRYDAAMGAINEFIDYREGDSFGLTIFGSSHLHWVPLTSDASAFRCAHPFLDPMVLPDWFGGGTMIAMALEECLKVLTAREEGDRMIILVSDGYSFDLGGGNDEVVARKLRDQNIVVYAVHIAEGEPPSELDTIARTTGGQVFSAGDPDALRAVFERVDEMQVTRMEKTSPEMQDHVFPYAVVGVAAIAIFALTLLGLRPTPW